jgi:AraC-like DNA-binding protein
MENPKIKLYFHFSQKEHFVYERETYDCSVLFINVSGSFQYRINNSALATVNPGEIVYCPPFCSFWRKALSPVELHMIKFEGELPKRTYTMNSRIREDLNAVSHIRFSDTTEDNPLLIHYLSDIYYTLALKPNSVSAAPIIRYMNENYCSPIGNAELCEFLHCSEVSLISQVRALTGKTPHQYINEKRIEYAKELLLSADNPIAEISAFCGFEDPLYFSKAFKRHTGMSPSGFKSKYKI